MTRVELPPSVIENLRAFGEDGPRWAARFQQTLDGALARWGLTLEAPYEALSYNFVARVRRGAEPLVLKLGVPNPELTGEIEALAAFAGRGAVGLRAADPERGALLLERVEPGTPLSALEDDDRAMAIAAQLLQSLWRDAPDGERFWSVARWGRAVTALHAAGGSPHVRDDHLEAAHRLLQTPSPKSILLHGDYHQLNVLQRHDGCWVAIDAKGAVGDRGYELWPLMLNCLDCADPVARLLARARRLASELGFVPEFVLEWTRAGAVLNLAWTIEDGSPRPDAAHRKLSLADEALARLRA